MPGRKGTNAGHLICEQQVNVPSSRSLIVFCVAGLMAFGGLALAGKPAPPPPSLPGTLDGNG